MFRRIDIANFGSYNNFIWSKNVKNEKGELVDFKRLNIIYGRNYSGKTTFSCIFQALETGSTPPYFEDAKFVFKVDGGTISEADLGNHGYCIRVYNRLFVEENLAFLKSPETGDIKPFAIIGSENVKLQEEIDRLQRELGPLDASEGLRLALTHALQSCNMKQDAAVKSEEAKRKKLTNFANGKIKQTPQKYGDVSYNITKLETDIKLVASNSSFKLGNDRVSELETLVREVPLPPVSVKIKVEPRLRVLVQEADRLTTKEIKPSKAIQDFLNDHLLQAWAKEGFELHRGKRENCGFCGQPLPMDLWERLDAHFNEESRNLDTELRLQLVGLEAEADHVRTIRLPESSVFYGVYREKYELLKQRFEDRRDGYVAEVGFYINQIERRLKNLFEPFTITPREDPTAGLSEVADAINNLISENNLRASSLNQEQREARIALRLNEVASYIVEIDLAGEEALIAENKREAEEARILHAAQQDLVLQHEQRIKALQIQLKDEKKGAERVNDLLGSYFGHEGLHLEALEDPEGRGVKFRVMRGASLARNMSEGERSLVAFCYFMAKLDDVDTKGRELVLFIDDPISSLDGNHIFFVFSLIENLLAAPAAANNATAVGYSQLFISTHNLEFLKYLQKLSKPKIGGRESFCVEASDGGRKIRPMPRYLQHYITEFNYLFHQIYKCSLADPAVEHDCFYNFGNNLRKFLEAYLFYKYPCHFDGEGSHAVRMRKFFGEGTAPQAIATRLAHEYSHLEQLFDRGMRPIEVPEIPRLAKFVLDKIQSKDPEQYEALLLSVGAQPAMVAAA